MLRHEGSGEVALLLPQRAVVGRLSYRIAQKQAPGAATAGVALRKRGSLSAGDALVADAITRSGATLSAKRSSGP